MPSSDVSKYLEAASTEKKSTPHTHIVLGSGFGLALEELSPKGWKKTGTASFKDFKGLRPPSAPDHSGSYVFYAHQASGRSVCFQIGRLHGYEGLSSREVAQTVMIPRFSGVENFILTNASGALTRDFTPGDVMLIRDHVNLTGQNPLYGENPKNHTGEPAGPRFPDLSGLYRAEDRARLRTALNAQGLKTHEGIYLGVSGPSFETPSEVQLFGRWGMHAVGMSTVWEAIALGHTGARVLGASLISNLGCGLAPEPLSHEMVLRVSRQSAAKTVSGIFQFLDGELNSAS